MIRKFLKSLAAICLISNIAMGSVIAKDNAIEQEVVSVVQTFLRGVYLGDTKLWDAVLVKTPGQKELMRSSDLTAAQKQELQRRIEGLHLASKLRMSKDGIPIQPENTEAIPSGAKAIAIMDFNGAMLIPLLREGSQWKVDPRYLLAIKKDTPENSPEWTIKVFMFSLFQKNRELLKKIVTEPQQVENLIKNNQYPGGDLDQLLSLSQEMSVIPAASGETVMMPLGQVKRGGDSKEEALYLGLYGTVELPFLLKKAEGRWKVVPQPYLEMMQAMGAI